MEDFVNDFREAWEKEGKKALISQRRMARPRRSCWIAEADAMHALLVHRADRLEGCIEGSPEEQEYSSIVSAIVAYEQWRWPDGKTAGGKG